MQTSQFNSQTAQFASCQQDLGSQICNALLQTTNMDNKARSQAEQFMS